MTILAKDSTPLFLMHPEGMKPDRLLSLADAYRFHRLPEFSIMIKSFFKQKKKLTPLERMVAYVIRILSEKEHEEIRSVIPDYKMPKRVVRESTGENYIPDVTAIKSGQFRLFAVETNDSLDQAGVEKRWKLFESYAEQNNSLFYLVFPAGSVMPVKLKLKKNNVEARLWQATTD
jgi:hypothetical protein